MHSPVPKSSIIISVYDDCSALRLILDSLVRQSTNEFEIIVSEDGASDKMKQCIDNHDKQALKITHLSQEDLGFRKNIALNRAIQVCDTEHIIFIDGDCVLHPEFVRSHQDYISPGIACTGRRVELGTTISSGLREKKIDLNFLTNRINYLLHSKQLLADKTKNIESGIYSRVLHKLTADRDIRLLGCNFSCHRQDLIRINGFNQDYLAPGIGEDSDIDWRLTMAGTTIKNVKFSAIQYHLHHPRIYESSNKNEAIFLKTQKENIIICKNGIKNN
ncbi:MAG: glycosyltransferase [Gammaproteobacteria bacterium]